MTRESTRIRRRGVRASRARLEHALAAAGLRTQAALAERIADLEDLDSPPKDLVNRVFREKPVDPQSLERVARALGVAAHTLYRTSTDVTPRGRAGGAEVTGSSRRSLALYALLGVLAVAAVVMILLMRDGVNIPSAPAPAPGAGPATPSATGSPDATGSLAILPFEGDDDGMLLTALRTELDPDFSLVSSVSPLMLDLDRPEDMRDRLQVDMVLSGVLVPGGRRVGIQVYLLHGDSNRLLWATGVPANEFETDARGIAADVSQALAIVLGRSDASPRHYPDADALEDYLAGWQHLDRSRTELNVKRALTRFESALRRSPDYPAALAGLCESLVQESIISREMEFLNDAETQCFRALQLAPGMVEGLTAWGDVLRKTGRADEAADAFGRALAQAPAHTDALIGMAEVELARYRSSQDDAHAAAAIARAQEAVASDPGFWKAPYVLGRILYFTGDVDEAVRAVEAAKALDPNEHVLSNLGTFQFCLGDHADALENYMAVKEIAPEFYVGDIHLGVVNYFLGNYAQAAELFQKALQVAREDGQPEDHRPWANLADAERHAGHADKARQAYERAAALAERDLTQGDNPENTRAYLAYYYAALLTLEPDGGSAEARSAVDRQLAIASRSATDVEALTRLAEAYVLRGDLAAAREPFLRATAQCRGFGGSPDLASLRE